MIRRTAVAGFLLAVGALALTGCQSTAGTAAFVGDQRISEQQLQTRVTEGLAQQGVRDAVAQQFGGNIGQFRRSLLDREIEHVLVTDAVQRTGVKVTDAQVRQLIDIVGGSATVQARQGMSAETVFRQARDELLVAEIGYTKAGVPRPAGNDLRTPQAQQSLSAAYQAGQAYVAKLAADVGVRVNPRYGAWSDRTLQVDPVTNPVLRLVPHQGGQTTQP